MKDYKRLTVKRADGDPTVRSITIQGLINRLAELEDKIENGTLIPKYSVVESCNTYCVCSVDTENLPIIDEYETEDEARKKLKELEK